MMKVLWVGSSIGQTCCQNSMSLLTASVVLVALYVLCRCLIPRLVQCNSTLALLWHDVLLEMMLDLLGGTTRPQVCVLEGESADLIPKMADMFGIQTFDFVFLDHWKDHYLPDIRLLEDCGLLARGSVVLADNVVCPGAPEYLNYVRSSLKYSSRFYQAHLEYTRVLDGLERSEYQGERNRQTGRIQTESGPVFTSGS